MTIKKFLGKTKEEAIAAAKNELGNQVVILNVKEVGKGGFLGLFQKSEYEVTAAVEDDAAGANFVMDLDRVSESAAPLKPEPLRPTSNFTAVADEQISLGASQDDLKSAFQEISEVIKKNEAPSISNPAPQPKPEVKTTPAAATTAAAKPEFQPLFTSDASPAEAKPVSQPKTTGVSSVTSQTKAAETSPFLNRATSNRSFLKILYNTLLDHELEEVYINQLLEDMGKILASGNSLDYLISNVYQKMVLKMGKPKTISLREDSRPQVVFLVGPTGVGKTTTIAKLASMFQVGMHKKVGLITSDVYRIAATNQLAEYARILKAPFAICYAAENLNELVAKQNDCDLILVDTVGFSHRNTEQRENLEQLLNALDAKYSRDIYLVLSATTKAVDLKAIVDAYKQFTDFDLIFTKLDETSNYGNVYNMKLYSGVELSYVTNGQTVPNDIEVVDSQKMVRQLLGGH
ncbi:MAG: flagellar biosynthesis protein FlhF [Lachnospiraceae bacterium]|nr:flagellar biosynthesis protein FlhF [Lachnospiraceae bacterium]